MLSSTSLAEEMLAPLPEQPGKRRLRLELLGFYSRHPNAGFTDHAISRALDCRRLDAARALRMMVAVGLVEERDDNGRILYSLTSDRNRRSQVAGLIAIAS